MFEKVGVNSDNGDDEEEYDGHEAGDVVVPEGRRAASLASAARAVAKAPDPPPGPMTYHQWLDRELEVFEILRTYSLPLGTFEEYASDEAGRTQSSGTQEQYMFDPWAVQYTAPPRYTSFKQSRGGKRETWQAPRQTFAGICVIDGEMEHVATPPHEVMCSRVREPYDVSQAYSKGYRNIHGIGAVFGLRRGSHTFMNCQHAPQMLPELEGFRVTEDMQGWRLFINARLLPTLPIYWVEFEAQQTDHTRFEQLGARCQLWDVTKICQIVSLPFNMTRLQYLLSHALRIPMNTVAECMQLSMADPKQQAWCDKAYEPLSPETHTPAETMRHAFDYAKTYVRLISMKLDGMMDALGKHQKKNRTRKIVVSTNMDQDGDNDADDDDDSDSDDDEEMDERGQPHDNMPNAWIKWVRHPETVRYFAQPVLQYLGQFFDMALLLGFGVEQLYELYEIINEQGLAMLGTERTIDPDRPASLHPIHRMFFRRTFVHSDHNPWNPGYCDLSTFVSYPHALTRRIRPTSMPELQLMNLFEVADLTLGANPNEYRAAPLARHLDLQLTITVLVYHVVKESYTRDSHPMMRMADVMARVKQYLNCNTGADMLVLSRTVEKMHLSKYGDSFRPIASICRALCKLMREQALADYPHSKNRSGGVIEIMGLKQFIRAVRLALLRLASASGLGRGCIVLEDGTNVTFSLPECDNEEDALMLREEVLSNEALWRKMRVYTICSWLTQEAIIRGLEKIAKNWKTEQSLVPGGFGAVHPFSMYAWKQRWRAPVFNAMWEAYWCLLVEWEGYKSIHEMEHPEDQSLTEQDQLEFGNDLESFPDVCQDVVMRGGFATPTEAKEVWAGLWEAMVRAGLPEPHELMMELLSRQQQHNQQQGVQFKEFMPCSEQLLAAMATKRSFLTSILGQGGGGKSAATAHILFHSYIPRQVLNARRISVEQRRRQPSYLRKLVVASHSNHAYNFRNTMRRYFDGCQAEGQDYYIGTIHKLLARHRAMCLNRPGLRNCPGTRKALKERWTREEQMGQSPWCHVKAHCQLCCFQWVEEVYLEEVGVSNDPDFQRFVTMLHRCCPNLKRLINMGDFGQLPPIGPGHVARDLPLATGYVPTEHGHSFHELVLMQAGTSVQKGDKKMKWSDGKVMFYHPASRVNIKGWPGLLEARRLNQKHIVDVFLQLFEQRMGTAGTSTPLRLSQCYLNTTTICWTNATRRMAAQLVDGMYLRERASTLGELPELWNHLGKNGETMSGTFYPAQKIIVKSNTLKGSTTNQMLVVYDVLEGFVEHTPYQEVARLKDEMYKSLLEQLRVLSNSSTEVPPGIWVDKLINKDHASMFKDLRRWTRDFLSRQKTAQNLEATALQDVSMFAMREVRALMDVSEGRPQSPALGHSFLQYHPDTYERRLLQCEPPERMNLSDTHPTDQCQVLAHSSTTTKFSQHFWRYIIPSCWLSEQLDASFRQPAVLKKSQREMMIHQIHMAVHETLDDMRREIYGNGRSHDMTEWLGCYVGPTAPRPPHKFYIGGDELSSEDRLTIERQMAPPVSTLRQMVHRAYESDSRRKTQNVILTENDNFRFKCTGRLPHSSASIADLRKQNKIWYTGGLVATKFIRCYVLDNPTQLVWIPCDWSDTSNIDQEQLDSGSVTTIYCAQSGRADNVVLLVDQVLYREALYTAITRARRSFHSIGDMSLILESLDNVVLARMSVMGFKIRQKLLDMGLLDGREDDSQDEDLAFVRKLQQLHISGVDDDHAQGGSSSSSAIVESEVRYAKKYAFTYPFNQRLPLMSQTQYEFIDRVQQETCEWVYFDANHVPYNISHLTREAATLLDAQSVYVVERR